jgi:prephenate dehydrogenase
MKICVVGLGLIGGSICMALKRAGYRVDGFNRSPKPLEYALENKIIDAKADGFSDYDVVFVALPPKATISFIIREKFKDGAIVADICGVKRTIEQQVYAAQLNVRYIGTHPMAGKEVSSVYNACANLFDRASMVITHGIYTDECAVNTIKQLVKDMGFMRIVECSAEVHDEKIAYTSQLAHIVSNCYVKDKTVESCLGFAGGSFQDMTRIAGVDENMWAELYLSNADKLTSNISTLINNLNEVNDCIKSGDVQKLITVLRNGREQFTSSKANSFSGGDIVTTLLHD